LSFFVYKSSAGSGKTFTLVKEYLTLILPEPEKYRHILAITFTNKAANEMKERVLHNLEELSKPAEKRESKITRDLLPLLIRDTGLSENEIIQNSSQALKLILHNYSDFAIGTIDSFSHRIIRTFAHDFGLPVNFNIELDSDELIETSVNLLLDRVGDDPELTNLLVRFIESRMDDDKTWNIETILIDFARILFDESGMMRLEKLKSLKLEDFRRIAGEIRTGMNVFETKIRKIAKEASELIEKNDLPLSAFYQGDRGIGGYFGKLAGGQIDKITPNSYVTATIDEDKWTSSKASVTDKANIEAIKEKLKDFYLEIQRERGQHYQHYLFLNLVAKTIYPLAVLNEISLTLDAFKKQNNLVHISEFNRRIAGIVLSEPVPFIYERLGERFNHILVDEFQDTSRLQWNNLQPLMENSLASGYFNLVVGDGKQAIYRWRNGDVEQFTDLPDIPGSDLNRFLKERENILKSNYKPCLLKENFRSKFEIVDFNNRFFQFLSSRYPDQLGKVFEDPVQVADPGRNGGYVNIEFISRKDEEVSYKEKTLSCIMKRIQELLADGFSLKDIAILCRKRKDGNETARFLTQNGLKVVSSEALLLSNSPEVNFITGVMKILHDLEDPVLAARLVTYLCLAGKLKEKYLPSVLTSLDKKSPGRSFLEILPDNFPGINVTDLMGTPVYELTEELIRTFGLDSAADPYLQFFLEKVQYFTEKHSTSTTAFLDWWESKKEDLSIITPEGLDAVRIMTIHKAKGLEFPVVIFPFAHDKKDFSKTFLWVDVEDEDLPGLPSVILKPSKDILETKYNRYYEEEDRKSLVDLVNLLYVAMTRACTRLYMMTQPAPESNTETQSIQVFLTDFLKESGEWSDEKMVYESGQKVAITSQAKDEMASSSALTVFISADWHHKMIIRPRAPQIWDVGDPQKKNRWGNLIHYVLSGISAASDLDRVLDDIFHSGLIEDQEKDELRETIVSVITHPKTANFFADELVIRKESEILLKDGKTLRPDRVILEGDQITMIDYKTGRPDEKHKDQLRRYEEGLHELGYKTVRKFLLYTTPVIELIEV
jgi:ATP-dependent exoDNAse (exonuclease V) beta subunit